MYFKDLIDFKQQNNFFVSERACKWLSIIIILKLAWEPE